MAAAAISPATLAAVLKANKCPALEERSGNAGGIREGRVPVRGGKGGLIGPVEQKRLFELLSAHGPAEQKPLGFIDSQTSQVIRLF